MHFGCLQQPARLVDSSVVHLAMLSWTCVNDTPSCWTHVPVYVLQVPFCVVFTKCDARKKGGPTPSANIKAWKAEWLQQYEELPACFETSSELGQGRAEVLNYLASLRVLEKEEGEEL